MPLSNVFASYNPTSTLNIKRNKNKNAATIFVPMRPAFLNIIGLCMMYVMNRPVSVDKQRDGVANMQILKFRWRVYYLILKLRPEIHKIPLMPFN